MQHGSHIGATIRLRRVEQEMSCAQLARDAGLSYSLTNKVERGDREPSDIAIRKIAKALRCSIDELVEPPPTPADVA